MKGLLTAIFAGFSLQTAQAAPDLSQLPQECQDFINKTLPANGWKGEFVTVPQDWQHPHSGPKIQVFYYYDASRDLSKATPILFLNGGPFSSYHVRMEAMNRKMQKYDVDKSHVLVMMDQRGTGCSVPQMPQEGATFTTFAKYASEAVVRDAEVIRRKMFRPKKWTVFAQSYGGFLAARYLDLYPQFVSSVHVYAPVTHENKTDFFALRILRQQMVAKRFFEHYADLKLERAVEKLRDPEQAKRFCIDGTVQGSKLCGQVLLDGLFANIGQGLGRDEGTTEVWDSVRDAMLNVINDNVEAFTKQAVGGLSFFRLPSSIMVTAIWAQEMQVIDGSNGSECDAAYVKLRAAGVDIESLPLDECRIIKQAVSPEQEAKLRKEFVPAQRIRTYKDILRRLKQYPSLRYYMYTGELDSLAQPESLQGLIDSSLVNYTHFERSGHAGWLYEPLVWQRLMEAQP